jgi:hypothetical protein
MEERSALLRKLRLLYPTARRVKLQSEVHKTILSVNHRITHVSFFDHKVGSQMRPIDGQFVLIDNYYLSSHVFNLCLCYVVGKAKKLPTEEIKRLFSFNLKKFFAEQVLYHGNVLIGRAMLLETLLYEQDLMWQVFAWGEDDDIKRQARWLAIMASLSISQHELAHYYYNLTEVNPKTSNVTERDRASVVSLLEEVAPYQDIEMQLCGLGGEELRTEFRCDLSAALTNLRDESVFHAADLCRAQVFIFYVLGELASIVRSAELTAAKTKALEKRVDLNQEMFNPADRVLDYYLGRDSAFDSRVDALEKAIERLASNHSITLFDEAARFPLTAECRKLLHATQDSMFELDPEPLSRLAGINELRRGLAVVLATALKGHDSGVEFLLWRSKTFPRDGSGLSDGTDWGGQFWK